MRTQLRLATVAIAACAVASLAFPTSAQADEFLRTGFAIWVPTGGATIEEISDRKHPAGELDDSSGIGVSLYGLLGLADDVDMGLALHYLPTVEHVREDKTAFEIGSQTDLNLRAAYSLPIPAVLVSVHGEGGLSILSSNAEIPRLPIDDRSTGLTYKKDDYPTDDTSSLGWNVGGGLQLGFAFVPFITAFVGVDFQYYDVQLFKGSRESPDNLTGDATDEIETNMTGSRVRLALGVEFSL